MPRALLLGCALTLAAAMPVSARAESGQSFAWCKGQGNPTIEQQIGACTALVEAKSGEARSRALNYFRRAGAYLRHQDFDKAISDFGDGLALDAGNRAAYYGRAIAYEAKKDTERAIADYGSAIELDPHNVKALSNRAAIYADQRAYERALEDNNRVIELEPDQAAGYVARGLTYARRGDFEYALRDFDKAIALDGKSAIAYFNRGRVYFSKGEFERAIQDYGDAIDIGPKNASAFEAAASPYLSQGRSTGDRRLRCSPQLDAKRATALAAWHRQAEKRATRGADDIAAAKAIKPYIAGVFEQSGVQR